MHLNFIFPTIIGIENNFLSKSDNEDIVNKCYSLKNKISLQHERWRSRNKSPLNSFDSYSLHKDTEFGLFFNKINNFVDEFAKTNEDNEQYFCSHAWFNIYNNNSYQEPHYHYMSTYSVVYYAKVPKNSAEIIFMNPSHSEATEGSNIFASGDLWSILPEENTAIIFRSNIAHFVPHGENDQDRISIAANYSLTPSSYKKITGFYE